MIGRDAEVPVRLMVDDTSATATAPARSLLIDVLRERLGVTGPHVGCDSGRCGACTVLLDGAAVKSCLVLAVQAEGAAITTAAGLADDDGPHPLQAAFHEHHALQCGYCTPGMLCAAVDLLSGTARPSEEEVRQGLRGNLCRCTGYEHVVDAVLSASDTMVRERAAER